ncbi:MAG: PocR ligand-binding domain-containing protein [Methanobacteriaceae archaeon]|jgi:PAS domain S-box-containing protein|nr:PocR ligand-binding domain-containing protein [Methanobacteriaceae archaeon]MDO9627668.1 PocR ligand-binding domain-containing protein [Methanobacteriaceae archaeon]
MHYESRTKEELLQELKELRESEKLNRLTLSSISDAVFITDNTGVFTFICPNVDVIFGYSFQEVEKMGKISKLLGADEFFVVDELEHLGEIRNVEHDIIDKSGNIHNLLVNVKKVYIDDGRYLYSCRDITERKKAENALRKAHEDLEIQVEKRTKQLDESNHKLKEEIEGHKRAEEALRESEEKLRLKLDAVLSPDVNIVDEELSNIIDAPTIQYLMDYFTELTGMATAIKDTKGNVLTATGWQDICTYFHRVNPETKRVCIQTDEKDILVAKNLKPGEYRAYKCDNGLYDVFTPLFIADKLVANIYTGQLLFEDEDVDESFFIERADKYGFNREEYLDALRRVPRVSRDKVEKTMKYLARFTEFISRLSYSNLMLARTIVEKEQAEIALRESEEFLENIIENIPNMIFVKNAEDLSFKRVNKAGELYFGHPINELVGKTDYNFFPKNEADFFTQKDREVLQSRELLDIPEETIETRELGPRLLHTKKIPMFDNEGNPQYLLGISEDITEIKRAEKELKSSLEEKEVLLREIHHRVKNNMQIISSLLNLQKQCVEDELANEVLVESQNRVKSMAMIHEKLYRSRDLSHIEMADYVESLVKELFYSYAVKIGLINPILDIDDITLNMETAVPCGLLISELVSNSLKHAFPEGREGEIRVSLKKFHDKYELTVSDNGVGWPDDLDFKNPDALGLQIVHSLVGQLEGDIHLDKSQETEFKLIFNELGYKKRL